MKNIFTQITIRSPKTIIYVTNSNSTVQTKRQHTISAVVLLVVCFVLVGASGSAVVLADEDLELTILSSTDVPEETVEIRGGTYHVDAVAVVEVDESLTAELQSIPDETVRVRFDIVNSDGQEVDHQVVSNPDETEQVTFTLDDADGPGTYSMNAYVDDTLERIHPIVVSGYDISVENPSPEEEVEATVDETIDINATVTPTESSGQPEDVEFVVWNDETAERFSPSIEDGSEYTASIDLSDFATDEYNVYVTALSDEEFRGEQEILGLGEGGVLNVTEADEESGGEGSDEEESGDTGNGQTGGGEEPIDDGDQSGEEDDNGTELDENGNETADNGTEETVAEETNTTEDGNTTTQNTTATEEEGPDSDEQPEDGQSEGESESGTDGDNGDDGVIMPTDESEGGDEAEPPSESVEDQVLPIWPVAAALIVVTVLRFRQNSSR